MERAHGLSVQNDGARKDRCKVASGVSLHRLAMRNEITSATSPLRAKRL